VIAGRRSSTRARRSTGASPVVRRLATSSSICSVMRAWSAIEALQYETARFGDAPFHGAEWNAQQLSDLVVCVFTRRRKQEGVSEFRGQLHDLVGNAIGPLA